MAGTRVKVYRTPAEMQADVADAAAHGWRVTDQRQRSDGTMSVTFTQGGSEWATPAQPPQVVVQAPPPAKKKQNPLVGCAAIIVVLLAIGYFAGNRDGSSGSTPRPTVRATPVGGFGTMEGVVDILELDLGFDGSYNDKGSWYSEVREDIGLSATAIKRGGVADQLEMAVIPGVDDEASAQVVVDWFAEFAPDAGDWAFDQFDTIEDGQSPSRRFGRYVATVSRFDIDRASPIVTISLNHD